MKLLHYLRPSNFRIEVLAAVLGVGSSISGCYAVSTGTHLTTFRMSDAEDEATTVLRTVGTYLPLTRRHIPEHLPLLFRLHRLRVRTGPA
jgi:hypothetical protein